MVIHAGFPAIGRSGATPGGWGLLVILAPCDGTGTMTLLEYAVREPDDTYPHKIGTFRHISGDTWRCINAMLVDVLTAGYHSYSISWPVVLGDVVAFTGYYGTIHAELGDVVAGCRSKNVYQDFIPGNNVVFDRTSSQREVSIYLTGLPPPVLATVTTDPATSVEEETAIGNGNITDVGGEDCDKRGICWNTTGNPTVADNKSEETDSFGTGPFSRPITGLSPGIKYYVKAYAHNSAGYGYGGEESFTTKPNAPGNLACVAQSSSQIDVNWIKGAGATKTMVRRKVGSYPSDVTDGEQAYYGTSNSFNDTSLVRATHYYYRAWSWVEGGNIWSDDYAEDNTWTLIGVPTITTDEATGLAAALATLNGTLTDNGGEACDCGFEWGLDSGYGTTTPTESKTTGETFSQVIGGLFPNTVYHFRALATNSAGTGHGDDRTFTTALVISRAFALARREL